MKEALNEMKMVFPSRSVNEGFARTVISSFAAQLDPTVDELSDVKTAVSEAVTNCIVHAYRDTVGKIELSAKILSGDVLYIRIKDWGCGISDIKQAMEPMFTTAPGDERAGLGFAVMESFTDRLSVHSKPGRGTAVILQKKFSSRRQGDNNT